MERTVPETASEEVELYLRTYYSLLRSTSEVQIRTLEEVHSGMNSLLHRGARNKAPDMSALIYSILRLPLCIYTIHTVILGQSTTVFQKEGIGNVEEWDHVAAQARRRRCFNNGEGILACIIASRSDIDDVIPIMTAYQIEWNKLHALLAIQTNQIPLNYDANSEGENQKLADALLMNVEDLHRLKAVWKDEFVPTLTRIAESKMNFGVRLLRGSLSEYRQATHDWWHNIEHASPKLLDHPVYFVSSNTHSLVNLVSGFALKHKAVLVDFLECSNDINLQREWDEIQKEAIPSSKENFFYYLMKKFLQSQTDQKYRKLKKEHEIECGITRTDSEHFFDVDVQVIEIAKLRTDWMDPRICDAEANCFAASDAIILNIDYPLGLGAYNILSKVSEHVGELLGVYILGKAATLNGIIGDVMITNVVHDEHSRNTYIYDNAFTAADVSPYLVYGTVLDNQKGVSVRGTFLQNSEYMDVFYREGYTDIEMEAGPYLSAVYEMFRPNRYPIDEIVNLYNLTFDLGILHYASDTPLGKGKNLGTNALSYFGMDPTYATSIAALRRILYLERKRLK
jgi:hypothetical protein